MAPLSASPDNAAARHAWRVGTAGYLCASLLWGLNLPLSAALLQHFDPFWVSPLRYAVATLLLGDWPGYFGSDVLVGSVPCVVRVLEPSSAGMG